MQTSLTGLFPDPFEMALGEKLFEESGTVTGFNIIKVHHQDGLTMEVSFISEIREIGRFPSGKNLGSGIMTQHSHGVVDASWQGSITTTEGEQFVWWAHEKDKIVEGGKAKGIAILTGFTSSQKLLWMNGLVMANESEYDPTSQKINVTGYEWI